MSDLFNKIKDLRAQAFKSGDKFLHSVLTNVFSDANPVGTAADQAPTNESVTAIVKKHLKGVVETLEALAKTEFDKVSSDAVALKNREKEILESLLPKQLTEDELHRVFNEILPSSVKDFMNHLKAKFAGLYDGKLAKKVFDAAIETQIQASGVNQTDTSKDDTTPSSTEPVAPAVAPFASTVIQAATDAQSATTSTETTQATASTKVGIDVTGNADGSAPGAAPSVPNLPAVETATK